MVQWLLLIFPLPHPPPPNVVARLNKMPDWGLLTRGSKYDDLSTFV